MRKFIIYSAVIAVLTLLGVSMYSTFNGKVVDDLRPQKLIVQVKEVIDEHTDDPKVLVVDTAMTHFIVSIPKENVFKYQSPMRPRFSYVEMSKFDVEKNKAHFEDKSPINYYHAVVLQIMFLSLMVLIYGYAYIDEELKEIFGKKNHYYFLMFCNVVVLIEALMTVYIGIAPYIFQFFPI